MGRAAAEGAGLTLAAAQQWISGKPEASAITDAQGTWAILTKGRLAKTDQWTHMEHGTDNNRVSNDLTLKWPFLPQWFQTPLIWVGRVGGIVTSNGRSYFSFIQNNQQVIKAYRIFNGQNIWIKSFPIRDAFTPHLPASFMAATDAGLYFANKNRIVFLDGETGNESAAITVDAATTPRKVRWLAVDNTTLYAFSGDTTTDVNGSSQTTGMFIYADAVSAYDLSTKALKWRKAYSGKIESRDIGMADGKLFFSILNSRVMCISAATGDSLWAQSDAGVVAKLAAKSNETAWPVYPATFFLCSKYAVITGSAAEVDQVALSPVDGHLLWSTGYTQSGGRCAPKIILNDTLFNPRGIDKKGWDLKNNVAVTKYSTFDFGGGCGVITGTPDGLFGNAGGQSSSFSLNRNIYGQPYKTDCGIGTVISDGMMMMASTGCECSTVRGTVVNGSAGSFQFDRAAVQSERLEQGAAYGAIAVQVRPDAKDWSAYRGNAAHSGYTAVTVSTAPHLMIAYTPAIPYDVSAIGFGDRADQQSTPTAVVGTYAYWGGTDGYIRCFDFSIGKELWRYGTAGAVRATPTIYDGCVYAGSEDGYAYCIEAQSGRLVWRFRGAPVERRINLYGHLASTWPINTGITIDGNKVMFSAGLQGDFGTHVYALDAKSGAIVWQNNTSGTNFKPQDRNGFSPAGYGIVMKGKFWQKAMDGRNGIFSTTDGTLLAFPAWEWWQGKGPNIKGREMYKLDSTHALYGGNYIYSEPTGRGYSDRSRTLSCAVSDAQGNPLYPDVQLLFNSTIAPAWDGQAMYNYVQNSRDRSWIERWNQAAYVRLVDSVQSARAATTDLAVRIENYPVSGSTTPTPLSQKATAPLEIRAMALSGNALVATINDITGVDQNNPETWKWSLCILGRTNLDTLWKTMLPGRPLINGLSLSRNGDIIVSMANGSVLCYGTAVVSVRHRATEPSSPRVAGGSSGLESGVISNVSPSDGSTGSGRIAQPAEGVHNAPVTYAGFVEVAPRSQAEQSLADRSGFRPACSVTPEGPRTIAPPPASRRRDMAWVSGTPCLDVASVTASSCAGVNKPGNAVDRDLRTRWTPGGDGAQWLVLDLGNEKRVAAATVVWFSQKKVSAQLTVDVSTDGVTFTPVANALVQGQGTNTAQRSFPARNARYVRVSMSQKNNMAGLSVYEVGVHEKGVEANTRTASR